MAAAQTAPAFPPQSTQGHGEQRAGGLRGIIWHNSVCKDKANFPVAVAHLESV